MCLEHVIRCIFIMCVSVCMYVFVHVYHVEMVI